MRNLNVEAPISFSSAGIDEPLGILSASEVGGAIGESAAIESSSIRTSDIHFETDLTQFNRNFTSTLCGIVLELSPLERVFFSSFHLSLEGRKSGAHGHALNQLLVEDLMEELDN